MRILLAEHHQKVLKPLRILITETTEHEVTVEVKDWAALLKEITQTNPDLVLLDWDLPGRTEKKCIAALRTPDSRPKVIVLSTHDEVKAQALEAGANNFVSKGTSPLKLIEAIQAIAKEL